MMSVYEKAGKDREDLLGSKAILESQGHWSFTVTVAVEVSLFY